LTEIILIYKKRSACIGNLFPGTHFRRFNLFFSNQTTTTMANETSNDFAGAVNSLLETVGKLGQQQVEMLNSGIKTASEMVDPLGKTLTDLAGNALNAVNQALQSASSAISGKK